MAGTSEGGKKASKTNKKKFGKDFYVKIGRLGGMKSGTGGFYYGKRNYSEDDPRHPRNLGRLGGQTSKRKKK